MAGKMLLIHVPSFISLKLSKNYQVFSCEHYKKEAVKLHNDHTLKLITFLPVGVLGCSPAFCFFTSKPSVDTCESVYYRFSSFFIKMKPSHLTL